MLSGLPPSPAGTLEEGGQGGRHLPLLLTWPRPLPAAHAAPAGWGCGWRGEEVKHGIHLPLDLLDQQTLKVLPPTAVTLSGYVTQEFFLF